MSDHFKRMWKYYLTLLLIIFVLFFSISWIYKIVQDILGREAALLSLTFMVMVALILGVRGAVHTHRIDLNIRKKVRTLEIAEDRTGGYKPVVLRVFNIDLPPQATCPEPVVLKEKEERAYEELLSFPRKRRGKQSRFSDDEIWKAVLKWEKRDTFFQTWNLEEFLEQEFGRDGGVLRVAPSTFYDWRRDVLKEIEAHQKHPPASHEKSPSMPSSSEPTSNK